MHRFIILLLRNVIGLKRKFEGVTEVEGCAKSDFSRYVVS